MAEENPNQPANIPHEVAERIRAVLNEAIEDAGERLVTRWAVVIESVGKDGGHPELERLCEPGMSGWDMRGFFREAERDAGWNLLRDDDDG